MIHYIYETIDGSSFKKTIKKRGIVPLGEQKMRFTCKLWVVSGVSQDLDPENLVEIFIRGGIR
jgi:hypothetical protein